MPDRVDGPGRRWDVTWDANRQALLDATCAATPAQRLAWLEDALRLAYRAGALPARKPSVDPDPLA